MNRPLRRPESRGLRLRLLGGLILWVSTLYCGPVHRTGRGRGREGAGLDPELAVLGFDEGSSPALASSVGRLAAILPSYEVARRELAQGGVHLDIKVVHRIAGHLGAELLATRTHDLNRYRAGQLPRGRHLAGKRLGVAIDGGRVRVRTVIRKQKGKGRHKTRRRRYRVEWREPKLIILFELDGQGRMARGSRPWIDGTFGGPDEILELLAMHLHRLGAAEAEMVCFLADGAPWIWDRLDWVIQRVGLDPKKAARVLDFCHAVHPISLALEALRLGPEERKPLLKMLRHWLRRGQAGKVIAELAYLARKEPAEAAVWTPIAFLERHAAGSHLDYRKCRQQGVPLGSGAIESAIRRVVNLRLKGSGILWSEGNAEAMLVMRAAALTDRWDETLEQVRESMATDRRLEWKWTSPDMPAELKARVEISPPMPQDQPIQQHAKVPA